MTDQPELIPGTRLPLPECYDEVAEAIENALANGNTEILDWDGTTLAFDIYWCAGIDEKYPMADIEKAIAIYHERTRTH